MQSNLNSANRENRQTHSVGQYAGRCRVGRYRSLALQTGARSADVRPALGHQRFHLADGTHHTS